MVLKCLRFVSLVCAALAMGVTIAHDLEIPGKDLLNGAEWLTIQNTFYGGFALVGGVTEVLGLVSTGLLAWLLRRQRITFLLTLLAALCFAGMLAVFAFGNQPINLQVARSALPANWRALRDAWDGFHAASSALAMLAFIFLLLAILRDTHPSRSLMEKPKS
ncbi:MAG TPA: hypothetical protein VF458_05980 [Ktedonobacteraceae bacterium]